MLLRPAVFLDRDGTLIKAIERPDFEKKVTAPFSLQELRFVPQAFHIVNAFRKLNFLTVMITNQPDVAYGYLSEEEWQKIHRAVLKRLEFRPETVYMCRHKSQDKCPFKKPSSLMLRQAADNLGIDLSASWMIGDSEVDMMAGKGAGTETIFIKQPYNQEMTNDYVASSLRDALDIVAAVRAL